jgi:NAD-dependent SIR2 family protein deacetylase
MHGSIFKRLITQNVDGLHVKALRPFWDASKVRNHILELHGTLFVRRLTVRVSDRELTKQQRVHCQRGHVFDRDQFQVMLSESNPEWKQFADELERTGQKPRTNPDGDVGT